MSNDLAASDHLFVCGACGKTSTTRYGFDTSGASTASPGWDESCMMNAHSYPKAQLRWNDGQTRVLEVVALTPPPAMRWLRPVWCRVRAAVRRATAWVTERTAGAP